MKNTRAMSTVPKTESTMVTHAGMVPMSLQTSGISAPKMAILGFFRAKLPKVAPKIAAEA